MIVNPEESQQERPSGSSEVSHSCCYCFPGIRESDLLFFSSGENSGENSTVCLA